MTAICVITARGGSKRIPRKNVREFCGKPIIAYSIEAAISSDLFDEIMVSTDDEEIADIARAFGASVPFMRSSKNSDDYATTSDVLHEVLESYLNLGREYDIMCCIYPTAPFVTPERLREAAAMLEQGAKAVMPVVAFSYPPQRGLFLSEDRLRYVDANHIRSRSQDLPTVYHDCGQFYMYQVKSFMEGIAPGDEGFRAIVLNECEVQDIDTYEDWAIAEMKYRLRNEGGVCRNVEVK